MTDPRPSPEQDPLTKSSARIVLSSIEQELRSGLEEVSERLTHQDKCVDELQKKIQKLSIQVTDGRAEQANASHELILCKMALVNIQHTVVDLQTSVKRMSYILDKIAKAGGVN